jgi:predicted translation initiation factor SUI1
VNGLIARLLGGSDAPPPPQSAPPAPAPPRKVHTVKLSRETAGRKGKGVTVVSDLPLGEDALKELATQLKNKCGTGGTAKDGRIEIQGDQRDKVAQELENLGYKVKRSGG